MGRIIDISSSQGGGTFRTGVNARGPYAAPTDVRPKDLETILRVAEAAYESDLPGLVIKPVQAGLDKWSKYRQERLAGLDKEAADAKAQEVEDAVYNPYKGLSTDEIARRKAAEDALHARDEQPWPKPTAYIGRDISKEPKVIERVAPATGTPRPTTPVVKTMPAAPTVPTGEPATATFETDKLDEQILGLQSARLDFLQRQKDETDPVKALGWDEQALNAELEVKKLEEKKEQAISAAQAAGLTDVTRATVEARDALLARRLPALPASALERMPEGDRARAEVASTMGRQLDFEQAQRERAAQAKGVELAGIPTASLDASKLLRKDLLAEQRAKDEQLELAAAEAESRLESKSVEDKSSQEELLRQRLSTMTPAQVVELRTRASQLQQEAGKKGDGAARDKYALVVQAADAQKWAIENPEKAEEVATLENALEDMASRAVALRKAQRVGKQPPRLMGGKEYRTPSDVADEEAIPSNILGDKAALRKFMALDRRTGGKILERIKQGMTPAMKADWQKLEDRIAEVKGVPVERPLAGIADKTQDQLRKEMADAQKDVVIPPVGVAPATPTGKFTEYDPATGANVEYGKDGKPIAYYDTTGKKLDKAPEVKPLPPLSSVPPVVLQTINRDYKEAVARGDTVNANQLKSLAATMQSKDTGWEIPANATEEQLVALALSANTIDRRRQVLSAAAALPRTSYSLKSFVTGDTGKRGVLKYIAGYFPPDEVEQAKKLAELYKTTMQGLKASEDARVVERETRAKEQTSGAAATRAGVAKDEFDIKEGADWWERSLKAREQAAKRPMFGSITLGQQYNKEADAAEARAAKALAALSAANDAVVDLEKVSQQKSTTIPPELSASEKQKRAKVLLDSRGQKHPDAVGSSQRADAKKDFDKAVADVEDEDKAQRKVMEAHNDKVEKAKKELPRMQRELDAKRADHAEKEAIAEIARRPDYLRMSEEQRRAEIERRKKEKLKSAPVPSRSLLDDALDLFKSSGVNPDMYEDEDEEA